MLNDTCSLQIGVVVDRANIALRSVYGCGAPANGTWAVFFARVNGLGTWRMASSVAAFNGTESSGLFIRHDFSHIVFI